MTAIDDKYLELGGPHGLLGLPISPEVTTQSNSGAFRHFQGGSIFWSAGSGAHEVHGAIRDKWGSLGWEQSFLGFPVTDETATPNGLGSYNHFQGGSIYWSPLTNSACAVLGAIRDKWGAMGWEGSVIGFPISDEQGCPDGIGRFNEFEWGSIYWTEEGGAHEVHGFIRNRWTELGRETGPLGYPTSDEHDFELAAPGSDGHEDHEHGHLHMPTRVSEFQGGSIYWDMQRGAYEVYRPPVPPPTLPASQGEWSVADFRSDVVGVHSALLRTGRVLFFSYLDPGPFAPEEPQDHGDSAVLDLATHENFKPAPGEGNLNLFCSGHAFLPDGRLLVAGGERTKPGLRSLHIFDPDGPNGGSWQYVRDMATGRWYPTPVTLPDGRIMIVGGVNLSETESNVNTTFEIFDPAAGPQPQIPLRVLNEVGPYTSFPFVFVLPDHRLMVFAGTRTRFLDLDSMTDDGRALEAAQRPERNARTYNLQGTSALLPLRPESVPPYRARVMVMGGGGATGADIREPTTVTCELLDLGEAEPAWQLTPPMSRPRVMPDCVLLPDGKVLVVNGSSSGFSDNGANPVFETEIYDPETNTWAQMANMSVPRLYHSGALLLPDGSVMTCGTDSMWNPGPFHTAQLRLEIFRPPYMFQPGERPRLRSAPEAVGYGTEFSARTPDSASVDAAALLRCGSTTHSFNPDQRYVGLRIVRRTQTTVRLEAPPDGFVAPPGYYMLFLLRGGVPSEAQFVRLG